MTAPPAILKQHGFEIVYGTDLDRAGAFLELGRRSAAGWEVLAEMFSPEKPGALTISMDGELPADVVQAFIDYGRARLADPGWGSRLTSA
jgi:hypothetical protein